MSIKWSYLDKIVFYIVICDLLFFPYISTLNSSVSLILLIFIFPINYVLGKYSFEKEDFLSFISLFIIVFSILKGYLNYGGIVYLDNRETGYFQIVLVNSALLIFCFLYWLYYSKFLSHNNNINVDWLFVFFIVFNFFLAIAYFYDPIGFFSLRDFWTMGEGNVSYSEFNESVRFTGIFSDPNNLSVCLVSVLAFVLFNSKITNSIIRLILVILVSASVFATMSSTGVVSLIFVIFSYMIVAIFRGRLNILVIVFSFFLLLFITWGILELLISSDLARIALTRVSSNSGSLSHRFEIYGKILKESELLCNLIIGNGSVFIESNYVRPHSGHLYLLYSYGLPLYVSFMLVFFPIFIHRSLTKQIYIVPLFLGFTLNVGIYDFRYIGVLVLLVSLFRYNKVYSR